MPRKYTRKDKINNKEEIKESTKNTQRKYSESFGIKSIALNDKQKEFYDVINNNIITFCKSPAGSVVPKYDNIGYFEFNIDDVVRSDIVKTVITAYSGD